MNKTHDGRLSQQPHMETLDEQTLETALRAIRAGSSESRKYRTLADHMEKRLGRVVSAEPPTSEQSRQALEQYRQRYHALLDSADDLDLHALKMLFQWEIGPDFRDVDWSKEPEEFRPNFDPDEFPRELAYVLQVQEYSLATSCLARFV